jgi:mycothiol synthase
MPVADEVSEGFELRVASVDDASAIAEIINEVTLAEVGWPWTKVEEIRDGLSAPGRDPALANALLVQKDGSLAGYLEFEAEAAALSEIHMLAFVRPHLWGRGLNAWLLRLGEERARARVLLEPAGERFVLRVSRFADNEPARRLFVSLGYAYVRTFWLMRIEFESAPPPPRVPDGIAIRTFESRLDEARVHAVITEAFADHWGESQQSFEQWRHQEIEGEGSGFDPSLWFLATDGEEVVGIACCEASSPRSEDTAHVGDLAVRAPWRRRGVGLALLHTAFREFYRRGIPRTDLGVDAENPTGATQLYERAGMHVALSWEFWEKELREVGTRLTGPDARG